MKKIYVKNKVFGWYYTYRLGNRQALQSDKDVQNKMIIHIHKQK